MLQDSPLYATVAVTDIDAARDFYGGSLGLSIIAEPAPDVVILQAGAGTQIQVYQRPDHVPSAATIATFTVTDLLAVVAALSGKGISFLDYDLPDFKTDDDHIVTVPSAKLAWVNDPADNIIGLVQR
jgi:catechol 2,3-dioxygenase-like lactoylglutathione lyase family enzyme